MTDFTPGLELGEVFYNEAVRPILDRRFTGLAHSAAKLDFGSDVLGFDTPQSMDHQWGPKVTLFLRDADCDRLSREIMDSLADELPYEIRGYPTNFDTPQAGSACMKPVDHGPICHGVTVTTVHCFFREYLGVDPLEPIDHVDWLLIPPQRLRTVASGKVFHDGLGELQTARRALAWYPDDVWLYLLACQWSRVSQEEPFVGRCGDVGDDLGSRIVATRLVTDLMKLCFLMERRYWTYSKWFGTAFSRLECAGDLEPVFRAVLNSQAWKEREEHLSNAYLHVGRMHNTLGITGYVEPRIAPFFTRPYNIPHSGRFIEAILPRISSDAVRRWPIHGAVGQFSDSTDVLDCLHVCRRMRVLYE